jgi:hypothetical protein
MKYLFSMVLLSMCFTLSAQASLSQRNSVELSEATISPIPANAVERMVSSVVMQDGEFRGAYIGEVIKYADISVVKRILTQRVGANFTNKVDYQGYKPRGKRGCKVNLNWICATPTADPLNPPLGF